VTVFIYTANGIHTYELSRQVVSDVVPWPADHAALLLLLLMQYGDQDIQLAAAEQLVDRSQTRAVAESLKWLQARVTAAAEGC